MPTYPKLVNLRTGRTANIVSVQRSGPNPRLIYVHIGPEFTAADEDSRRKGDPQAFYKKEDIFRVLEAASKEAHKVAWPRELRVFVLAVPIALVLIILGLLGYWQCYLAAAFILVFPVLRKKRRVKIIQDAVSKVSDTVIEGSSFGLLTQGSTLDPFTEVQKGVWVTPTTVVFERPGFWD